MEWRDAEYWDLVGSQSWIKRISRFSDGDGIGLQIRSHQQTSGVHSRFEYSEDIFVSHRERVGDRFERWATIRSLTNRMFPMQALFILSKS